MNLVYEEGCLDVDTKIDDKDIIDREGDSDLADLDTIRKALQALINKSEDRYILNDIFMILIAAVGEYEDLGYCDQCGSYKAKYTYNTDKN